MKIKALTFSLTLASAASIFAVIAWNGMLINASKARELAQSQQNEKTFQYPEVDVIETTRGSYRAVITGHGEARPKYDLSLVAEVSGQVEEIVAGFESGKLFKEGEILTSLTPVQYLEAVASAKAAVAEARLALLEEQRQGQQAQLEWKRSGLQGQPDSLLVLRQPQLEAAEAALEKARSQLARAEYDLKQTEVRAPFNSLVVSREVQPGSYVQPGSVIATLYNTDRMEISIPLSSHQWRSLPDVGTLTEEKWPVLLTNSDHTAKWTGYVERSEQHVDGTSRQRSIVVVVESPLLQDPPLLAGEFIEARIQGMPLDGLWKLPASSITQNGEFWYVNETNHLVSVAADKQFEEGDQVYVTPVHSLEIAHIVVRPLLSYVPGMEVTPTVEGALL